MGKLNSEPLIPRMNNNLSYFKYWRAEFPTYRKGDKIQFTSTQVFTLYVSEMFLSNHKAVGKLRKFQFLTLFRHKYTDVFVYGPHSIKMISTNNTM
jgi:hypothetical protein